MSSPSRRTFQHALRDYPCPFCGSIEVSQERTIHHRDRFEVSLGLDRQPYWRVWIVCAQCLGARVLVPLEASIALDSLGSNYYEIDLAGETLRSKFNRVMGMPYSDNLARVERVTMALERYQGPHWHQRGALLDVGSGLGVFPCAFLSQVQNEQWSVTVVETDPLAITHLKSLPLLHVCTPVDVHVPAAGRFNLLTFNKVLEHVANPQVVLSEYLEYLVPTSNLIYVEVPSLDNLRYASEDDNALGSMHKFLFAPKTLEVMFDSVGLELLEVQEIRESSGKRTVFAFGAYAGFSPNNVFSDKG